MQPTEPPPSPPPRHARSKLDIGVSVLVAVWWIVSLAGLAAMPWMTDFFLTLFQRAWPVLLLAIVLWSMAPILATILIVRRFRTGDPRGALRLMPLPIAAVVLWFFAGDIATLLRFNVERSAMMETIKAKRPPGGEAFVYYFKWDGMSHRERGILFDESGEIRKPAAQRSATWKQAARRCLHPGEPLGGHFYLVRSGDLCS